MSFEELNKNYKLADSMPMDALKEILKISEDRYYNDEDLDIQNETSHVLDDEIYDYCKEVYKVRLLEAGKEISKDPLEHMPAPKGKRLMKLPVWMNSINKVNRGTGEVAAWLGKYSGPYVVSAKMDGASSLYFFEDNRWKLYSHGRNGEGQDISELLGYLKMPVLKGADGQEDKNMMLRGELILKKSVFEAKYRRSQGMDGKPSTPGDLNKYKNSRNAVAGLVNKVGSRASGSKSCNEPLNVPFLNDLEFVAYEVILKNASVDGQKQLKQSEQFKILEEFLKPEAPAVRGFYVAYNEVLNPAAITIDDDLLSKIYDEYLKELDYEIDGLVIADDGEYERITGDNPAHVRAYKKPLESLTRVTKVNCVEWNVSKDGFIKPTVLFEPIHMDGVTISRATGYNGKFICDQGIGVGALIMVTRAGGVIPKIIPKTIEKAEVQMPKVPWLWNETNVDLLFDDGTDTEETRKVRRDIGIQQLCFFVSTIGAKGVGESTVTTIYDLGFRSILELFTLTQEDIKCLGPKASENVIKAIQLAVGVRGNEWHEAWALDEEKGNKQKQIKTIHVPTLMAASGIFGRGLGIRTFVELLEHYPEIVQVAEMMMKVYNPEEMENELTAMIVEIKGFGEKTARQVATGFWDYVDFLNDLSSMGFKQRYHVVPEKKEVEENVLKGKNVVMTGFRDAAIESFVKSSGGKIQSAISGTTNMVISKNATYSNTKTQEAQERGLIVMTREDFVGKFLG